MRGAGVYNGILWADSMRGKRITTSFDDFAERVRFFSYDVGRTGPLGTSRTTPSIYLISVNFVSKRLFEKANTRFRKKKELI